MKKKSLLVGICLILVVLLLSSGISQTVVQKPVADPSRIFDKEFYRQGRGIYVDSIGGKAVSVSLTPIRIKWGYDEERVSVSYKQAYMPFWFEHDLPVQVDPCSDDLNFVTDYPTSLEFLWDYNRVIKDYNVFGCDSNGLNCKRTLVATHYNPRTIWRSVEGLGKCPLQQNRRYWFRHEAQISPGQRIVFDVNAVFDLPAVGRFVFSIPEPEWISTAFTDFNSGVGFDFNWTKVTQDGNVMPTGSDKIYVEQDQAFYDQNLVGYWRFNDTNADGSGVLDDSNNGNDALLVNGTDTNAAGMWDTNAGYFDGVNDGSEVLASTSYQAIWEGGGTAMAWILPFSESTGGRIFQTSGDWALQMDSGAGNFIKFVFNKGWSTGGGFWRTTNAVIPLKTWTHVAVAYDGDNVNNTPDIYVNGILTLYDELSAPSGSKVALAVPLWIGERLSATGRGFDGFIEEAKLYDRALTVEEIAQDYNAWMTDATYTSPIFDGNSESKWQTIRWQENTDVNNSITFDARGCGSADCSQAGDWVGGLNTGGTDSVPQADGNRFFQYRMNFDTNSADWNPVRATPVGAESGRDYGFIAQVTDVNVVYNRHPDVNVWMVDGFDVQGDLPSFNYVDDGNLIIDFNVEDWDNYELPRTADIKFDTTQTQGAGTVIVDDLSVDGNFCITAIADHNSDREYDINLVGYWRFNGDSNQERAIDSSQGASHGLYIGGADNNTQGKWDTNAGFFDGVDDGVSTPNESNFDFNTIDTFSFSAWIYLDGTASVKIVNKQESGGGSEGFTFETRSGTPPQLNFLLDGTVGIIQERTDNSFAINTWHHVVVTYDGSDTAAGVSFYVNGIPEGSFTLNDGPIGPMLNNANLHIGTSPSLAGFFDGSIEEVKIYDKELTASEISQDFNDSFVNRRKCTWGWDIQGVADNNYFVNIETTDSVGNVGYDSSNNSMRINPLGVLVWNVDGFDVSGDLPTFTYATDGNITIDFNVTDYNNFADFRIVDINFSATAVQGTGTNIVDKLNVDGNVCLTNYIGNYSGPGSDADLLAFWKFDGLDGNQLSVADSSGNENHGQYANGADNNTQGKWDTNAFFGDGVDDYADTVDIDFPTGGYTMLAWVKTTSTSYGRVLSKFSTGTNQRWFAVGPTGGMDSGVHDGVAFQECNTTPTTVILNDGEWHQMALIVTNTNVTCYADGQTGTTDTHDDGIPTNNEVWRIGARNDDAEYFSGEIEDIRFYDRALTVPELVQEYEDGLVNRRKCSWDWDYSAVADANYFVNITVKDAGGQSAFDSSGKSMHVVPAAVDSCSCPASGWWEIIGGDACTLDTLCDLVSGGLNIDVGSLNITSSGILTIPATFELIVKELAGNFLSIATGGQLVIKQ